MEELLKDWYRARTQESSDAASRGKLDAEWCDYRRRLGLPEAAPTP